MTPMLINGAQMKRLQTLYGQLCAHTQQDRSREARLAWAGELLGHPVESFSAITREEANRLLDTLGGTPAKPRRMSRQAARRHGKDGRRDGQEFAAVPQIVSAEDIAAIESLYARLGWTRDRFDAWMRSSHGPLKRADATIRTTADANRVRWALKGMLKHQGLWEEKKPA